MELERQLLQRHEATKPDVGGSGARKASARRGASAGRIIVRRKLSVGAADDPLEVEAERAAEDVMRALASLPADGSVPAGVGPGRPTRIRRRASSDLAGGRSTAGSTHGAEVGMAGGAISGELSSRITQASGGTPLGSRTMSRMEHGFGTSFAHVRVHAQSHLPRQIAADAFTSGSHLFFAPGMFDPSSHSGERLLAHELAHVVQQGASRIVPRHGGGHGAASGDRLRIGRRFNQVAVGAQTEHFNGVTATYDANNNFSDLHIGVGANNQGTMGQDVLRALWAIRDELRKGEARAVAVPGRFEMHPQGAVVVKDTMEMLGEAFGAGPSLGHARNAKAGRKAMNAPLTQPSMGAIVDPTIVTEHIHYRDSLVGSGVSMGAVGAGMGGGVIDMMDTTPANAVAATNVRAAYDAALMALQPLSLVVSMTLAQLNTLISRLEGNIKAVDLALLKVKHFWSY